MKRGSISIHTLTEMNDDARDCELTVLIFHTRYEIVCLLFLLVFLDQYDVYQQRIKRENEPVTINGLI